MTDASLGQYKQLELDDRKGTLYADKFDKDEEKGFFMKTCCSFYPSTFPEFFCFWFVFPLILFSIVFLCGFVPASSWVVPSPKTSAALLSEFSAERALVYTREIVSYGPRVMNTPENKKATEYVYTQLQKIVDEFQTSSMRIEIEYSAFDAHPYRGSRNVMARISDRTLNPDASSVMVSAHIDSGAFSTGAADDASMVGTLLEMFRNIVARGGPPPWNPIIFLFTNGEETNFGGSLAFMRNETSWSKSVQRFINLDATGSSGKSILYRTNPSSLVTEYYGVPYPHATVIGEDLMPFIPSETDFATFTNETSLLRGSFKGIKHKLNGFDVALYQNGYFYHTKDDTIENLSPGSVQQTGENTLFMITKYAFQKDILKNQPSTLKYIYYDAFGGFITYPEWVAVVVHCLLILFLVLTPTYFWALHLICKKSSAKYELVEEDTKDILCNCSEKACLPFYFCCGYQFSIILAFLSTFIIAALMSVINPLSWYGSVPFAIFLYAFPALLGLVAAQWIFFYVSWGCCYKRLSRENHSIADRYQRERYLGLFYLIAFPLIIVTAFMIRSGYILAWYSFFLIISVSICIYSEFLFTYILLRTESENSKSIWIKILKLIQLDCWWIVPLCTTLVPGILTWDMFHRVILLFVPLTGRARLWNADIVIGSLVTLMVVLIFITYLPFSHRASNYAKICLILCLGTFIVVMIASFRPPYTIESRKRYSLYSHMISHNSVSSGAEITPLRPKSTYGVAVGWDQVTPDWVFKRYKDPRIQNLQCSQSLCTYNTTLAVGTPTMSVSTTLEGETRRFDFSFRFDRANHVGVYGFSNFTRITFDQPNTLDTTNQTFYSFYSDDGISTIDGTVRIPNGRFSTLKFDLNYWDLSTAPVIADILKNVTELTIGPQFDRFTWLEFLYQFNA